MTTDNVNLKSNEDVKVFTFRALDPILHTTWKTCAAMSGVSMEEFGVQAIRDRIKKELSTGSALKSFREEE